MHACCKDLDVLGACNSEKLDKYFYHQGNESIIAPFLSVQIKESSMKEQIHCVRPSALCVEEPGAAEGCSQLG